VNLNEARAALEAAYPKARYISVGVEVNSSAPMWKGQTDRTVETEFDVHIQPGGGQDIYHETGPSLDALVNMAVAAASPDKAQDASAAAQCVTDCQFCAGTSKACDVCGRPADTCTCNTHGEHLRAMVDCVACVPTRITGSDLDDDGMPRAGKSNVGTRLDLTA